MWPAGNPPSGVREGGRLKILGFYRMNKGQTS
jgi:hypothetical protein